MNTVRDKRKSRMYSTVSWLPNTTLWTISTREIDLPFKIHFEIHVGVLMSSAGSMKWTSCVPLVISTTSYLRTRMTKVANERRQSIYPMTGNQTLWTYRRCNESGLEDEQSLPNEGHGGQNLRGLLLLGRLGAKGTR